MNVLDRRGRIHHHDRRRTRAAAGSGWSSRLVRAGLLTGLVDGVFSSVLNVAFYGSTVARLFQARPLAEMNAELDAWGLSAIGAQELITDETSRS